MGYDAKSKQRSIDFARENYKRVPLDIGKSEYETLKASASAAGESVNGYIKEAIKRRMQSESAASPDDTA